MISQSPFRFSAASSQWAKRGTIALFSLLVSFESVPLHAAPLPDRTQLSEAQPRRSPSPAATSTSAAPPRPLLKQGSQGEAVSELQAILRLLGYYTGAIDGVYQESTASAVAAFQRSAGLQADGVAGSETWVRLLPPSPVAEAAAPAVSPAPSPAASPTPSPAPSPAASPAPSPAASPAPNPVPRGNSSPISPASASTLPSFTTPVTPAATPSPAPSPAPAVTPPPTSPTSSTLAPSGSAAFPSPSRLPAATPSPAPAVMPSPSLPAASPAVRAPAAPAVSVPAPAPAVSAPAATTASPSASPAPVQTGTQAGTQPTEASTATSGDFPTLRVGMRGSAVNGLQTRLQAIGVFSGAIDGVFGAETQEAVKAAQRNFNLDADGVVGAATWAALMK